MSLVKRPFADSFAFARPVAAAHRDANGVLVNAGVDQPRFDHDDQGNPKGLLVAPGVVPGEHDAIATAAGWDNEAPGMILHEYDQGGEIRRVAFYTVRLKDMADACLRHAVHHREIIAVDGYLRNRGGYVRYDGRNWDLGDALAIQSGPLASPVLADGAGRLLIEG